MLLLSSPLVGALAVALLWSIPSITQTLLLRQFPIHVVMTFSAIFYLLFVGVFMGCRWRPVDVQTVWRNQRWIGVALASAFFGGFLPNFLFARLLQTHPAYWVTAVTYCSPLFTTLWAMFFLAERPSARHFLGIVAIVAGIICIADVQRE